MCEMSRAGQVARHVTSAGECCAVRWCWRRSGVLADQNGATERAMARAAIIAKRQGSCCEDRMRARAAERQQGAGATEAHPTSQADHGCSVLSVH